MNELMDLLTKENFLVLPGGSDINPRIYGKDNYASHVSSYSIRTDEEHIDRYYKALAQGRPVFGICRGMQLASALNGLTLIQDMDHPHTHEITVRNPNDLSDEKEVLVNSLHHQLVWTENKLDDKKFKVYGYCSLSDEHLYQKDEDVVCTVEPEIIYFPDTNTMGVQFHPEMMYKKYDKGYDEIISYLVNLIKTLKMF